MIHDLTTCACPACDRDREALAVVLTPESATALVDFHRRVEAAKARVEKP